ncbi:MAG TPA: FxLYD domain-containing protein [Nitrososphaeraceae archaeon]|jgi:hypothetical protein
MGAVGAGDSALFLSLESVEASTPDEQVVLLNHQFKSNDVESDSITGQIQNIGNDSVETVKVFASTYDMHGEIIEADAINATVGNLNPGQKSSFNLTAPKDKFGDFYDYDMSIQWLDSEGQGHTVTGVKTYSGD